MSMSNYFYKEEANLFTFYRIPKELFTNPIYRKLSNDAKILYGLLLDRNSLSTQNNWCDDEGRIYIIYSRANAMEDLNLSDKPTIKAFKDLIQANLIEELKRGLGKPNIIYVKKFIPQKLQPQQERKISVSGIGESPCLETENLRTNNTNINNTNKNKTTTKRISPNLPSKKLDNLLDDDKDVAVISLSEKWELYESGNATEIEKLVEEKNITKEQISKIKKDLLNIDLDIERKAILKMLLFRGESEIYVYIDNWNRFENVKNKAGFFIKAVIDKYSIPTRKGIIANFEQREYDEEEMEQYYTKWDK